MPAGSSPQSRVVRYGCGRSFRGLGCCAATLVVTAMTAASNMRFISTPELSRAGVEAGGGNGLTGGTKQRRRTERRFGLVCAQRAPTAAFGGQSNRLPLRGLRGLRDLRG